MNDVNNKDDENDRDDGDEIFDVDVILAESSPVVTITNVQVHNIPDSTPSSLLTTIAFLQHNNVQAEVCCISYIIYTDSLYITCFKQTIINYLFLYFY